MFHVFIAGWQVLWSEGRFSSHCQAYNVKKMKKIVGNVEGLIQEKRPRCAVNCTMFLMCICIHLRCLVFLLRWCWNLNKFGVVCSSTLPCFKSNLFTHTQFSTTTSFPYLSFKFWIRFYHNLNASSILSFNLWLNGLLCYFQWWSQDFY